MKNSVKVVAHPETNLVFTPSTNNPEWCTFRVDSEETVFANGIADIRRRSAFIRLKVEIANKLDYKAGQLITGKIIKKESYTPFYEGQPVKINPNDMSPALYNGREVYMQQEFTQDLSATDIYADSVEMSEDVETALQNQSV